MRRAARCQQIATSAGLPSWQPWSGLLSAAQTQPPAAAALQQHCRWTAGIVRRVCCTSWQNPCSHGNRVAATLAANGVSAHMEAGSSGSSTSSSATPWHQPPVRWAPSSAYTPHACGTWARGYCSSPEAPPSPPQQDVVYKGLFSHALKRLKQVSLLNTGISLAAAPVLLLYADVDPLTSVTLATSMVSFGLLTTSALHWFTSSYIHELRYEAASQSVSATTLTLLARQRHTRFQLADVAYPDGLKPLATFQANKRVYYIDKDAFPDKALLQLLTPPHPQAAVFEEYMKQQRQQP